MPPVILRGCSGEERQRGIIVVRMNRSRGYIKQMKRLNYCKTIIRNEVASAPSVSPSPLTPPLEVNTKTLNKNTQHPHIHLANSTQASLL